MNTEFIKSLNMLDMTFHHIGYATESFERDLLFFQFIGYQCEGQEFLDLTQGIRGQFIVGPGPRIELLENSVNSKTLTPWLRAGIKMYHFAYEVPNLAETIKQCKTERGKVVIAPTPAIAFGQRQICFVMFRNGQLIEFIEK